MKLLKLLPRELYKKDYLLINEAIDYLPYKNTYSLRDAIRKGYVKADIEEGKTKFGNRYLIKPEYIDEYWKKKLGK